MEISQTVILKSGRGRLWEMIIFQGPGWGGGGVVHQILSGGDGQMGAKIKIPKKSHAKFLNLKNFQKALNDIIIHSKYFPYSDWLKAHV